LRKCQHSLGKNVRWQKNQGEKDDAQGGTGGPPPIDPMLGGPFGMLIPARGARRNDENGVNAKNGECSGGRRT